MEGEEKGYSLLQPKWLIVHIIGIISVFLLGRKYSH